VTFYKPSCPIYIILKWLLQTTKQFVFQV
jgi:hypothetical protein